LARKRRCRRRQEGLILEHVAQYSIESGEDKPVTAARKFIQAEGILPPSYVKRNEHTTDRYLGEKGLFGSICRRKSFLVSQFAGVRNPRE